MRIKKRELLLITLCVIIVAAFAAENLASKSFFKFSRLSKEIALGENKLLELNAILKYSDEVNAQYERVIAGYKEIADSDSLLREIEDIAKKTNLNILNIKPSPAKEEALYKIYSIKIQAQDEILSVARFINSLTEGLKSAGVERVQINSENKNELPKVTLLINAAVFKQ